MSIEQSEPCSAKQQLLLARLEKLKIQNAILAGGLIQFEVLIPRLRRIRAKLNTSLTTWRGPRSMIEPLDELIDELKQKLKDNV